ncbi:MAG: hypothetical protein ACK2TZ_09820, partial [Anaerolineales bacterium]
MTTLQEISLQETGRAAETSLENPGCPAAGQPVHLLEGLLNAHCDLLLVAGDQLLKSCLGSRGNTTPDQIIRQLMDIFNLDDRVLKSSKDILEFLESLQQP